MVPHWVQVQIQIVSTYLVQILMPTRVHSPQRVTQIHTLKIECCASPDVPWVKPQQ